MNVYIDGDGCPVIQQVVRLTQLYRTSCTIVCDTAHCYSYRGVRTLMVQKGADCVDFALVNLVQPGDLVVTQDYGLAAMCLARRAIPLHQNGWAYREDTIDALLNQRYYAQKIRRAGGRVKGPSKRRPKQNKDFETVLEGMLKLHVAGT